MLRSPITRWLVGIFAFIVVLGVLRFKPWHYGSVGEMFRGRSSSSLQELQVGYLPRNLSSDLSRYRFRYSNQYVLSI